MPGSRAGRDPVILPSDRSDVGFGFCVFEIFSADFARETFSLSLNQPSLPDRLYNPQFETVRGAEVASTARSKLFG